MSEARRAGERGATLVDVLTSMTLVLLLIAMTQSWMRAVLYAQRALEMKAAASQDVILAIEAMARDVRNAGFGHSTEAVGLAGGGISYLELTSDVNSDGDIADAHEHVRYDHRADRRQVRRASGDGNPQPFVDDVPAGGLHLSFFDAQGQEVTGGDVGLNEAQLQRVRRIDIRLVVDRAHTDPQARSRIGAEASIAVALRNR